MRRLGVPLAEAGLTLLACEGLTFLFCWMQQGEFFADPTYWAAPLGLAAGVLLVRLRGLRAD